ncbi:hypothetical protein [Sulfitobacter sp. 1A13679]|uniref:hypothetical protein n=1 Tax=Sulfitobacter sp. 1A13679 TaxID=3368597 RepID=UPI0037456288
MKKIITTAIIALTLTTAIPASAQAGQFDAYIDNYVQLKCGGDYSRPARRGLNIPGTKKAHRGITCATAARMDAVSEVYTAVAVRIESMPEAHHRGSDGFLTSSSQMLLAYAHMNHCAALASEYTVLTELIDYRKAAAITKRYSHC